MIERKCSTKLYDVNRHISLKCVAMKELLTLEELNKINLVLADLITEIRALEKLKNE